MEPNTKLPLITFLSSYPPTSCGLATFTLALREAIASERGSETGLGVVSLVDSRPSESRSEVVYEHVNGNHASLLGAIDVLNSFDTVFVQHEYGIYGGPDGNEVIDLLSGLEVPVIATLHTVLSRPTRSQRSILATVAALADQTIVMSETACRRLVDGYEVDPKKVRIVQHGAPTNLGGPSLAAGTRPVVLTWGLIGPGKGLEMAIDAFAGLADLRPLPRYLILGKTHPKVQARHGNAYLESLSARVHDLGLDDMVEFDNRYLDTDALAVAIRQADLVLLPYDSTEQVTSGVLVEALAAGKPVVATAFPHAVELLRGGAGIVVPHDDPNGLTAALRNVLTDAPLASRMAKQARQIRSEVFWPAIANQYDQLAAELVVQQQSISALFEVSESQKALTTPAMSG